jgi:putative glutamate/gamma-aminobutyrate antiporter
MTNMIRDPKRVISVFTLIMINVIAIDSLRNVPAAAEYGFSLVFYYLLAGVTFFIPTALVAAELATGWPETGGVYIWVRHAFGPRLGLLAIWLQWIENVIWYPTMLAFIASTFLYAFSPALAVNPFYLLGLMLSLFWLATFLNMFGMRISGLLSTLTACVGTIIPMLAIVSLGIYWLGHGNSSHIHFSWHSFMPDLSHYENLSFLTAVLLSLVGVELSATHAQEVIHPQHNYPRAILIATIIILSTLILSSLAIAIVVPRSDINLVAGLIQAFDHFLKAYGLGKLTSLVAFLIVLGGFGGVAAWIIGPSKGLLIAAREHRVPRFCLISNRFGSPTGLLLIQSTIFSGLCVLFLFFKTINSSYWILSVLATQLYMVMYILIFLAAIRLRYSHPEVIRSYRIPGGKFGIWLVGIMGTLSSLITIAVGFIPPSQFDFGGPKIYFAFIILGFILFCLPPLCIPSLPKEDA